MQIHCLHCEIIRCRNSGSETRYANDISIYIDITEPFRTLLLCDVPNPILDNSTSIIDSIWGKLAQDINDDYIGKRVEIGPLKVNLKLNNKWVLDGIRLTRVKIVSDGMIY
jgi:hypothetical protein